MGVVALTLALTTFFVLNRLDDYFTQQQRAELNARTQLVADYVDALASDAAGSSPVVSFDNEVHEDVIAALQENERFLADSLAQANVDLLFGRDQPEGEVGDLIPATNGALHAELEAAPRPGQTREPLEADPRRFHSLRSAYPYSLEVRLSAPYTFRGATIANVTSLLAAVGVVALGLAIVAAAGMAIRFTTPLRRLTETSRSLAEGDLSKRIEPAEIRAGSSELTELAEQFNAMADRLEDSVAIMGRDRDRSRDFLADVSHELRTPIAALLTFNELLTERAGSDPQARAEFLEASRVQLERLDWLAQNLLELSKLDSGLVLLDLRPDDLRAAVESAVEQAGPAARRRGVRLSVDLAEAPLRVRHDPQRVGQIVTNLVGNAIKFTPPGGAVTVTAAADPAGARIEVADTGVGIEGDELPRIFDRFYRGSRANEARGSGSGLGLAIVRSIVDMHHGTVSVESTLGSGSRFTVIIPRDPRAAIELRSDTTADSSADASGEPSVEAPAMTIRTATTAGTDVPARTGATNVEDSSPSGAPSLNRESSG